MKNIKSISEKYYIHSIICSVILLMFFMFSVNGSLIVGSVLNFKLVKSDIFDGCVYPIEYVPDILKVSAEDRKKTYEEIDSKFFVKTPIYNPNVFDVDIKSLKIGTSDYNNSLLQRVTYTVPYMGSYNFDFKEYNGSHPGIDISAPKLTPVKSIANGVVVDIGFQANGFGNYILIRHDNVTLPNGKKSIIYSTYAHLDSIIVTEGIKIKKGALIGKVGSTGNSTNNHLHFQIDIEDAPYHPYWPFGELDINQKGINFFDGVNQGVGKQNALLYTINPLDFVNKNLNYNFSNTSNNQEITEVANTNLETETKAENNDTKENVSKNEIINNKETETKETKVENNDTKENVSKNEIINNKETEIKETKVENNEIKENVSKNEIIKENFDIVQNDIVLSDNVNVALLGKENDLLLDIRQKQLTKIKEQEELKKQKEQEEKIKDISDLNNNIEKEIIINKTSEPEIIKSEQININKETNNNPLFKDINSSYKYYKEIKYFKDKGIIKGFEDNYFRPEKNITRSESLKIILLTFEKEIINDLSSKFKDIKSKSWENSYINSGIKYNIISPTQTNFRPYANFTWVESLKIVLTLANVDLENQKQSQTLGLSQKDWYYKYINYAINNGLYNLNGKKFEKNKTISRENLLVLLYKIKNQ